MPKLWRKRELLVKVESTYGVDPTPTGASNAILVSDATIEVEGEVLERELVRGTIGDLPALRALRRARLKGAVELAGSGAAGTAPKWGPICRAAGMSETVTPATKVEYKPVSSSHESVTAYWFADGLRHRVLGARGNAKLRLAANEIPRIEFELTGLYEAPTDTALPGGTYTGWSTPRIPNKANTTTCTLHSLAAVCRSLDVDLGNEVVARDLVNAQDVILTDRAVTGQISIEAVPVATKAWFAIEDATTLGALSVIHGTSAGNIIELAASNVQILNPQYEEQDGVAYQALDLRFTESAGDDDFTLIVR